MQDRTIACGLATVDQHSQSLIPNAHAVDTHETLLFSYLQEETNADFKSPNNDGLLNQCLQEIYPEQDTMLLSNFANYQSVIQQKIVSATENLPYNGNGQQVLNLDKIICFTSTNSEYQGSNLLNNLVAPITQNFKIAQQIFQGQIQTEIQSKLIQDLPKQIIEVQNETERQQFIFQQCVLQPTEGVIAHTGNEFQNQEDLLFISHAVNQMPIETTHICFVPKEQVNIEQKLLDYTIEKPVGNQQFQVVTQNEPTQYSVNSDYLIGMIQDNVTNTQARTQFRFNNLVENEFDFSQLAQIRLEKAEDEAIQCFNQEFQVTQNVETTLNSANQRQFEENNNLSLEVNINSDSKNYIIQERKQLASYLGTVYDIYENLQKQNIQDNPSQNVNQEISELKTYELDAALEQICKQGIVLEEKPFYMEISQPQIEYEIQNTFQGYKNQVTSSYLNQLQNHEETNVLPVDHEQKNTLEVVDFSEQNLQPELNNIEAIENHSVQPQTVEFNQNIGSEILDKKQSQNEQQNNWALHGQPEVQIQEMIQPQRIVQQEINAFQQSIQVEQPQRHCENQTISLQKNLNIDYISQENNKHSNPNMQASLQTNQIVEQAQREVEFTTKSIQVPSLKKHQSNRSNNKNRRTPKNQQNTGDERIKTENIQQIYGNFNNFGNLQPCFTININRNNDFSLNFFRNYNHSQNDSQPQQNSSIWEKQFQEKAIQAATEKSAMFGTKTIKNMTLQREQSQKQDTLINVRQQQSISQKLNKIRKMADHYMLSGLIQEAFHKQFEEVLKTHVLIRFTPEPIDELGRQIFKDGLVLAALVKMIARSSKTPFLQNYIFQFLQSTFTIESNNYLFRQESTKAKANFENYLAEKYQKNYWQRCNKEEQPVIRRVLADYQTNVERKLTLQSNNFAVNQSSRIQTTRKKQNNLSLHSSVQKMNILFVSSEKDNSLTQKQNVFQNDKKELDNKQLRTVEKKTSEQMPQTADFSLKLMQQQKEKDMVFYNQKTEKKMQKAPVVMQEESPYNSSIQEIDDNNFKHNLESPNETRLLQESNESKFFKAQKPKKYVDLKMNSLQKNQCVKQVQACLQTRNNKFSQLYEKYKKIRESRNNESFVPPPVPPEDKKLSVTKSVLWDSKDKDLGDKKKGRHVQFVDEPLEMRKEEAEAQAEDEGIKIKKRKRTKKIDNTANEEQEQVSKLKKSKR